MGFNALHNENVVLWKYINGGNYDYFTLLLTSIQYFAIGWGIPLNNQAHTC